MPRDRYGRAHIHQGIADAEPRTKQDAAQQCVGTDKAGWCARFAGSHWGPAVPLNAVLNGRAGLHVYGNKFLVIAVALVIGGAQPDRVWACSVPHVASASEITLLASVIVRVRVDRYAEAPCAPGACHDDLGKIQFTVLEVLKGSYLPTTVHLWGKLDRDPTAPSGAFDCFSTDYKTGAENLLFLDRFNTVAWAPLADTNKEVNGANDPWVHRVREEIKRLKAKKSRGSTVS